MNGRESILGVEVHVALQEMLGAMSEEQVVEAMQIVATTHGLSVAMVRVPDGADKSEFAVKLSEKLEELTGNGEIEFRGEKPEAAPPTMEFMKGFEKVMRQKAEIERANIQHCEHNSRASLALQVYGITLNTDHDIETLPASMKAAIDTAANTLRDAMIGVPSAE